MTRNSCDDPQILKPVRKIGTTRRSVSGYYMFRGESAIQFESTLERDFIIRKEFSRSVQEIISQPAEIPFKSPSGRQHTYTPDFLVYYRLGSQDYLNYPVPLLVEVKPRAQWRSNWRKWLPKWKAAHRYAKEQGWMFQVQDESRIRDTAFENIRFLERYKRMSFPEEDSAAVLDTLMSMGSAPVHYVLSRHFMGLYKAEGIANIWHLLASRRIECDISKPLTDTTTLWVPTYE